MEDEGGAAAKIKKPTKPKSIKQQLQQAQKREHKGS